MKTKDIVTLDFEVDPYTSIMSQLPKICPSGYKFLEAKRKGNTVKVTYIKGK